jgi:transposase
MDTEQQGVDVAQPYVEVELVDPEVIRQIRALGRLKWGAKRIASEMGLARNTVRRYLRLDSVMDVVQERPGGRALSAAGRRLAEELLQNEAEGNAVVAQRLLAERGHEASLRTVQRAVAAIRAEARRVSLATVRYETAPGHQLQIDFGEKLVSIGGVRVRVYVFVAVLGFSRRIFARPMLSQRQEDWQEGIAATFEHFGGVPQTLLIDNPKAMVLSHSSEGKVVLHPAFEAFCKEWGVSVRACRPYRARTKGKTESGVKFVKRNGLAGLSFVSFEALESHLRRWMDAADARVHGTTGEAPAARFEAAERLALAPLPARVPPARQRRLQRHVANDAMVNVDSVRYSVPHRFVGSRVEVHVGEARVAIYAGADRVAEHRRSKEPRSQVTDPAHYEGLLKRSGVAKASEEASDCPEAAAIARPLAVYEAAIGGGSHDN